MREITPGTAVARAFEQALLPRGVVLVAVSGGPDSMALLAAVAEEAPRRGAAIAAGHVDHGWRGERSAADARFVERWCARHGIPFHLRRADGPPPSGRSREDAARELRYALLAEMREAVGADAIATAHTRDDAAETLLLAAFRGRPLGALSGIRRDRSDGVRRPFRDVSRAAVIRYLRERRIPWRRDATNDDVAFDRNWVRRRILPALRRRFGEPVVGNLAASAEALSRDREWIESAFAREILPAIAAGPAGASADAGVLAALPAAALRRALLAMAERAGGSLTRFELLELEARVREGKPFRFQAGRRIDFRAGRGRVSARAVSRGCGPP